jgi:dienelactone hydrolase
MKHIIVLMLTTIFIISCQTTGKKPASFDNPDITNVGIVFMHGKGSGPSKWIPGIVRELRSSGYMVISPRMPWADGAYGKIYSEKSEKLLDGYVTDLRNAGAEVIILGGLSAGGAGAIVYGAAHDDINGVMLVGPPATVPDDVMKLNCPILWIRGKGDSTALSNYASAEYKDVPDHPLNQRTLVNSDHKGTPEAGKYIAIDWVKKLIEDYEKTSR